MKYSDTHEWVALQSGSRLATIGITDYAQRELGEIVYVELPQVGRQLEQGEEMAILESTKAAIDLYTPLSGKVVESNLSLVEAPEQINQDPMAKGWLIKLELSNLSDYESLLDEASYKKILSQ